MKNSFADVHPELVDEWSERNAPFSADDVTYGSNKLFWWKGRCGHEWQGSPKSRSAGERCPICAGIRIVEGINDLRTLMPELAMEWSEKNGLLLPTMVGIQSHKKVIWRDKLGHEWLAEVRSRAIRGTGCPYCTHSKVLPGFNDLATCLPGVAAEWSERNLPLKPSMVTAFANRKVWWKCQKGHEWYTLIASRSAGSKCPYCSRIRLLHGCNDFATVQPELAKEWSDKNLPLTPDMVNEKSRKKVWWQCRVCGYEWQSLVKSRVKGTVCPVCADRTVEAGYNDLATTDPDLAAEWNTEKNKGLRSTTVSRNSLRFVWWKDAFGHEWRDRVFHRAVEGAGCKECEKEFQRTLPRLLISAYTQRLGVDVKLDDSEMIGLPLVAYLPELRLAFDAAPANERKITREERLKEFLCKKQGIRLIYLPLGTASGEEKVAEGIRRGFREIDIFISSDIAADIQEIRERFFTWKKRLLPSD